MNTTTTVRLTDDERVLLAELARECGTQSAAIGEGIRLLARRSDRRKALREFLDEWAQDIGPPDPAEVAEMRRRYFDR